MLVLHVCVYTSSFLPTRSFVWHQWGKEIETCLRRKKQMKNEQWVCSERMSEQEVLIDIRAARIESRQLNSTARLGLAAKVSDCHRKNDAAAAAAAALTRAFVCGLLASA